MIDEKYNGVVEDPRSPEEKALDYKHEDLAMGPVELKWVEYDEKNLKSYIIQNQDGSSSCVAQGVAKLLAIHEVLEGREYKRLCPKFIYTRRSNYPDGGMWLPNALAIACEYGSCDETFMPCDNQGETFMNNKSEPAGCAPNAQKYKGKYYFEIVNRELDNIAQVLQQGYGVLIGARFDYNEWTDVPFVDPNSKLKVGHGFAVVDYCLYKGEKAVIVEDSWGPGHGKGGRRILTESFIKSRVFYAGYVTSLPNFKFTKLLKLGSTGLEVKQLQEKLGIKVDGKFGKNTKSAVQGFQRAYGLVADGIVGPKTREKLNK